MQMLKRRGLRSNVRSGRAKQKSRHLMRLYELTGFQGKRVWDWLDLLIIPIVLAIGGITFNQLQSKREEVRADQRNESERAIAIDNQRDQALQTYLDNMSELLLERELRTSSPGTEVRNVARTRTLSTLNRLDGERNSTVIQFLREAALITTTWVASDSPFTPPILHSPSIVSLSNADLTGVDLHGVTLALLDITSTNLSRADLTSADLTGANLTRATLNDATLNDATLNDVTLTGATLFEATLTGANLTGATLSSATLTGANLTNAKLGNATLSWAILFEATLTGANLTGAILTNANLTGANLTNANLTWAILTNANLTGANLTNANLFDTDLTGANLSDTDLTGANLTNADLRDASYSSKTKWPDDEFDPSEYGAILREGDGN